VKSLRVPPAHSLVEPIIAPSFDHAVKDPDPAGVKLYPRHRIVVIEGLYCFLSIGAWKEAGEMLDERWLTTVDFEKATERIIDRHVTSGVAGSTEVTIHWSFALCTSLTEDTGGTVEGKGERHAECVNASSGVCDHKR